MIASFGEVAGKRDALAASLYGFGNRICYLAMRLLGLEIRGRINSGEGVFTPRCLFVNFGLTPLAVRTWAEVGCSSQSPFFNEGPQDFHASALYGRGFDFLGRMLAFFFLKGAA